MSRDLAGIYRGRGRIGRCRVSGWQLAGVIVDELVIGSHLAGGQRCERVRSLCKSSAATSPTDDRGRIGRPARAELGERRALGLIWSGTVASVITATGVSARHPAGDQPVGDRPGPRRTHEDRRASCRLRASASQSRPRSSGRVLVRGDDSEAAGDAAMVTGIPAAAGAATADEIPGTTSTAMPAAT